MTDLINKSRQTAWILIITGAIGLFASVELLVQKINLLSDPNYVLNCDINPVLSCGSVITTDQASAFGFPNPIWGIMGFPALIMLGTLILSGIKPPKWMWLSAQLVSTVAFVFMVWLIYQSLYVIGALCPWCMVVWAVTIPIFWVVLIENIKQEFISFGSTISGILISLKWILIIATYIIIIGLIYIRWADFWLS